jgi:hypothetical protein
MTAQEFAEFIYNVPAFALGQTELSEEQVSNYSKELVWVIKNQFINEFNKKYELDENGQVVEVPEVQKEVILTLKKILFDADCLTELDLTIEQVKENFAEVDSNIEFDTYTGSFKEVNGSKETREQWEHTGNEGKDNEFVYHDEDLLQFAIIRKNRNGFNYVVVYDKQEIEPEVTESEETTEETQAEA